MLDTNLLLSSFLTNAMMYFAASAGCVYCPMSYVPCVIFPIDIKTINTPLQNPSRDRNSSCKKQGTVSATIQSNNNNFRVLQDVSNERYHKTNLTLAFFSLVTYRNHDSNYKGCLFLVDLVLCCNKPMDVGSCPKRFGHITNNLLQWKHLYRITIGIHHQCLGGYDGGE